MIGDHVYVFFTFFGPDLEEKEEDKRRSIFARASAILFTVDITHMRCMFGKMTVHTIHHEMFKVVANGDLILSQT